MTHKAKIASHNLKYVQLESVWNTSGPDKLREPLIISAYIGETVAKARTWNELSGGQHRIRILTSIVQMLWLVF